MIMLLLVGLALQPADAVPERVDAVMPSVFVSTRGLIADGPNLAIDGRVLAPGEELAGGEPLAQRSEEAVADLAEAVEEDRQPGRADAIDRESRERASIGRAGGGGAGPTPGPES